MPGLGLVDCDVHPHYAGGTEDLRPYLDRADRRRVFGADGTARWASQTYASQFTLPHNNLYIHPAGVMRRDAATEDGGLPGSDPGLTAAQLLDRHRVDRAILTCGNVMGLGALPEPTLAAAIARATNRWLGDRWLDADARFRGSIVVSPHDAETAAAEIHRAAADDRFVQVFVPLTNALPGERRFWPIYAAAAAHGLPICLHPNSVDTIYARAPSIALGVPTYYLEWHTALIEIFHAAVMSFVAQGVFQEYPELRLLIAEGGFAWVVDLMWRMDKNWRSLRDETPWLTEPPSTIIRRHVRFSTQPALEPERREDLHALCALTHAEDLLLYSSDYPHWDFDNPSAALKLFPSAMRSAIAADNARALYGTRL